MPVDKQAIYELGSLAAYAEQGWFYVETFNRSCMFLAHPDKDCVAPDCPMHHIQPHRHLPTLQDREMMYDYVTGWLTLLCEHHEDRQHARELEALVGGASVMQEIETMIKRRQRV